MSETPAGEHSDPWDTHFAETGHSCGQVGDYFYCPACGYESGTRPIASSAETAEGSSDE